MWLIASPQKTINKNIYMVNVFTATVIRQASLKGCCATLDY